MAPQSGPSLPFAQTFAASAIAASTAEVGAPSQQICASAAARRAAGPWQGRARADMVSAPPSPQIVSIPLDTAKVKLQLQAASANPKYK